MRAFVLFTLLIATGAAAQLPAGTRDATDNSRQEAIAAKLRDAEAALDRGDFTEAAKTLKAFVADHPHLTPEQTAQLQYDLGFADERTGADDEAATAYAAAIAAAPSMAEPRIALGLLDARAGRAEKAHASLAAAANLPDAAPQLRARAFRALAQLDETANPAAAGDELLAAIKLTGETPADTALSASLAAHSGNATGAEAAYRRVLNSTPDDADAAAGLAHLLQKQGHSAEAEEVLAAPLKAHPGDPRLVSQMAALLAAQNKPGEAIPLLLQLRTDPQFAADPALTRQLARLYAVNNQNAEAETLFRSLLAAGPPDPATLDDFGSVLVRQQKYAEAEQVLAKAVSLRDKFPTPADFGDAAGHLAFAASKNAHPEAVLQALALRATVLPNTGPSLFLEATAHDTLHQYKEAIKAYRAFLAIAAGQFPDQEFQARHRLVALEHTR